MAHTPAELTEELKNAVRCAVWDEDVMGWKVMRHGKEIWDHGLINGAGYLNRQGLEMRSALRARTGVSA